ncbi:copper resistance protein NlpE [Aquiflexum lacus]|uniref:copper resistance protein NlpE n=1 Tax=Aquiflexum lacus TaxID=2483805 RepID=UPI001893BE2A|nr:copper resistance protein NlpE [Aquiflexum lacus]
MNKKQSLILLFLAGFTLIFSCQKSSNQDDLIIDDEMFEDVIDNHTSQNSLDYHGIYKGLLPCADCEGIEVTLELGPGDSYTRKSTYLGKDDNEIIESSGTFSWNGAGNTITLHGEDLPNQFFVGENVLFQLDMQGNRITGELADNYKLNKQ